MIYDLRLLSTEANTLLSASLPDPVFIVFFLLHHLYFLQLENLLGVRFGLRQLILMRHGHSPPTDRIVHGAGMLGPVEFLLGEGAWRGGHLLLLLLLTAHMLLVLLIPQLILIDTTLQVFLLPTANLRLIKALVKVHLLHLVVLGMALLLVHLMILLGNLLFRSL